MIELVKSPNLDDFVKCSNSRRANFAVMRRTYRTLNDCEMQHNAEVGLFTKPSKLKPKLSQTFGFDLKKFDAKLYEDSLLLETKARP